MCLTGSLNTATTVRQLPTIRLTVVVLVVTMIAWPLSARQFSGVPEGFVEIDGKNTPEKIPDYLAWEGTFRTLRVAAKGETRGVRSTLHLSREDDVLVDNVVAAQRRRDDACEARQKETLDSMAAAKADKASIRTELYRIVVACRQQTLDAADQLLATMSAEGRVELETWVQQRK